MNMTNPVFIFVDGSYYCFHRYYALQRWWKSAYPTEPLDNPYLNEKFVEKFKKTFVDNLRLIPKKLGIDKTKQPILFVGKDCKRENIWRNKLYPEYKSTREPVDGFMGAPFFKMAYDDNLFLNAGVSKILNHTLLEADDCIALSVKHLIKTTPDCTIYIITSDNDYLQLNSHNIHLYNLAYKNLSDSKIFTGNAENDLKIKILMGDTSDNIPSVFPKCGIKTAKKCVENEEFLIKKMNENPDYRKQYILNETLVSFDKIPVKLIEEFLKTCDL